MVKGLRLFLLMCCCLEKDEGGLLLSVLIFLHAIIFFIQYPISKLGMVTRAVPSWVRRGVGVQ